MVKLMHVGQLREGKGIFLTAIRAKLLTSKQSMERELEQKGKPIEKELLKILKETCSKIENPHQRKADYDTALFFLYVYHKDHAHHDQVNYAIHQVLINADKLLPKVEWERRGLDYLDSSTWRINLWKKAREKKDLKRQKELERREKKLEKKQ